MIVFAVSQLRSYDCNEEQFFGTERIFLTMSKAKAFIEQEIADIVSGANKDDHDTFFGEDNEFENEVYFTDDYITSGGHKFLWDISPIELDSHLKQKIFAEQQHEYDIEDIKNTIELEDGLLYDHIRDIPVDTMHQMAYLKREKEENGMAWNDAASEAIRETINQ